MRGFVSSILVFAFIAMQAQFTITGVVTNETGEMLSFATVYLEHTNIAASTNEKGEYVLNNVPAGTHSLKATFIGYRPYIQAIQVNSNFQIDIQLKGEIYNIDQIEIQATRVGQQGPFTNQTINKSQLQKENDGQDVPFILQWTPSMVVTSDAGAGIGYTGLRLRGSDQTRINVTINGVPLNDSESHNVFWVDLPDLMGSVNSVQIQRGVGTSTNGAGSFGGSVSINTNDVRVNSYLDVAGTMGAFNTRKISVKAGTGLLNDRYMIDAKYSTVNSDGYIDRASSDLKSYAFSATRLTAKSSLRFNVLSGKEITYQAWYGTPVAKLNGGQDDLLTHYYNNLGSIYKTTQDSVNLFSSDRRYNYYTYPNQVDNYRQTHIQLIHALVPAKNWKTKMTLFYTKGKGYFEEYKTQDKFENYGLPDIISPVTGDIIDRSNIVRRRWLDNDLLGILADFDFKKSEKLQWQGGIAANHYVGNHFGNVISIENILEVPDQDRKYYDNQGRKTDVSAYTRMIYKLQDDLAFHFDVQGRNIHYEINGIDNDLRKLTVADNYLFINPKAGVYYQWHSNHQAYLSLAIANKEPSRGDFIDNALANLPTHEHLANWEAGYVFKPLNKWNIETNLYFMNYKNQLVLTGDVNDVGAPIRVNVPKSYRLGWEGSFNFRPNNHWAIQANLTLSKNKIKAFDEVVADYTVDFKKVVIHHQNTDISFSPSTIGALQLAYHPIKNFEIQWSAKYIAKQYLDNTSDDNRSLPAYHFHNLRLSHTLHSKYWKNLELSLAINNVLNRYYSANGYTYSYIYGSQITENFVYPQAGRHWMLSIKVGL